MASKFIKGLFEKTTILDGDWLVMQPDVEESTAYRIKKSNTVSSELTAKTWYVSTVGSDSNKGSLTDPFKNLMAAHAAASSNDIIQILDVGFTSSVALTFTKPLIIIGPANNDHGILGATISSTLSLSATLTLINVKFTCLTTLDQNRSIIVKNSYFNPTSLSTRLCDLEIYDSTHYVKIASQLRTLTAKGVYFEDTNLLSIGRNFELYNCVSDGSITAGLDVSSTTEAKNVTIKGALTVTGTLEQEQLTVLGALSVSGTTTGGSRFPGQVAAQGLILSFTGTPAIDFNESICQQMTLTGNITDFTTTNEFSPVNCDVYLINDGSVRTVVAPTGWTADPTSETHTTAASAINRYQFYTLPDGTKFYNLHIVKA